MIIAICGFMGAGKSSFLKMFPEVNSIDLDELIEKQVGEDLGFFIRKHGWIKFRNLESECLELAIDNLKGEGLLSLGGGALDESRNINILKNKGVKVLHLVVEFSEAMERIKGDQSRPQLDKSMVELQELYTKREKLFSEERHFSLPSDVQSWPTNWTVLKTFF